VIGWLDCTAGASGDMLLGALVGAGVPLPVLQGAVDLVAPERVLLREEQVTRAGLVATRVHVDAPEVPTTRTWADVRGLLAPLPDDVEARAVAAFERLVAAEAAVHGVDPGDVHLHEAGALDAIADVVGCAAGFAHLGLADVTASAVAVGSGTARTAHGTIPVPGPAVLQLLTGVPVHAGPIAHEACTPTGAAVVVSTASAYGPVPALVPVRTGTGAGGRDPHEAPNVVRLVLGEPVGGAAEELVVEANVDDLDPRVWPAVLERLLAAGARDAWLTPVLMKKGRPAHTLSVLLPVGLRDDVLRVVFTETTTIGVREHRVTKTALARTETSVDVDGHRVRVKASSHEGRVVSATPEYDDVAAAAAALGRPVRAVLEAAQAAARAALSV
jgi:pyridinium-3,5-bisthiocarboxylic acid mononucleotide nickel chelatase